MKYRTMGKTGVKVSALGFGAMRLPHAADDYNAIDEEESIRMLRYSIDEGLNYIDTAWPYHGVGHNAGGNSEPLVAKVLEDGYREKVHIATKLPSWAVTSREDMDKFLDAQLERLKTDCIDFYLLHSLTSDFWNNLKAHDVLDFMDEAKASGKVKYMGFSFHDELGLFKEIVDAYDWDFCQIQYNYMDQDYQAGTEGLEYAAAKGLGVVVMEPLRGGNLARLPKKAAGILESSDTGWSTVDLALNWVWSHPGVSLLLSGMSDFDQVVENVNSAKNAVEGPFSPEQTRITEDIIRTIGESLSIGCTGCRYCMPCPVGVDIPRNFQLYNDLTVYENPNAKFVYHTYVTGNAMASACIECGKCEELCPQHLEIRELLKDVDKLFSTP